MTMNNKTTKATLLLSTTLALLGCVHAFSGGQQKQHQFLSSRHQQQLPRGKPRLFNDWNQLAAEWATRNRAVDEAPATTAAAATPRSPEVTRAPAWQMAPPELGKTAEPNAASTSSSTTVPPPAPPNAASSSNNNNNNNWNSLASEWASRNGEGTAAAVAPTPVVVPVVAASVAPPLPVAQTPAAVAAPIDAPPKPKAAAPPQAAGAAPKKPQRRPAPPKAKKPKAKTDSPPPPRATSIRVVSGPEARRIYRESQYRNPPAQEGVGRRTMLFGAMGTALTALLGTQATNVRQGQSVADVAASALAATDSAMPSFSEKWQSLQWRERLDQMEIPDLPAQMASIRNKAVARMEAAGFPVPSFLKPPPPSDAWTTSSEPQTANADASTELASPPPSLESVLEPQQQQQESPFPTPEEGLAATAAESQPPAWSTIPPPLPQTPQ